MGGEDGGAITIGNTLNFRLDIVVGDDGEVGLEGGAVGGATEVEAFKVFGVGVAGEYGGQHFLLDGISITCGFLYELEGLGVLLASRWAQWG